MNSDEHQEFQSDKSKENLSNSNESLFNSESGSNAELDDPFTLELSKEKPGAPNSLENALNQALSGEEPQELSISDEPTLDLTEHDQRSTEEDELIRVMTENEPAYFESLEELPQEASRNLPQPVAPKEPLEAVSGIYKPPFETATERSVVETAGSVTGTNIEQRIAELQRQEQALKQEIAALQVTQSQLREQTQNAQMAIGRMVQEGLKELEQRKQVLQISVEQLERRQERIRNEMRTTFAGVSQDLAIRVQSFKDYLVGSLQDLALSAEQLELPKAIKNPEKQSVPSQEAATQQSPTPKFAEQSFQDQTRKIRSLLDQYRNRPDYYGPAWHLRRTFEPIHAERVSSWFFTQGGRGAVRTMGSRLQNILVASASISILHSLYGNRLRTLVLADSPERLGEWRRGLQDCLGITRSDFGPDRGVALFEDPEALAMKADRAVKDGLLAFVVIDETEEQVSLSLLQFPLWLAFAPNPQVSSSSSYGRSEW